MNSKSRFIFVSIFFILGIPVSVLSHGDLHERIKKVTKEIKAFPDSTHLYLKRGELYLQHEEFKKALKDFKTCEKRDFSDITLSYNFAAVHYAMEDYQKAIGRTEYIIDYDSSFVRAYRLQGLSYLKVGQYEEAALSFENVINRASSRIPENYFEASMAWENCKSEDSHCRSLDVITEGIADLGELHIFYKRLVDLNVQYGDVMPGIDYQTKIIEKSQRKERGLFERALLYLKIGYIDYAKKDLNEAQLLISKLPDRLRTLPATKDLSKSISSAIKNIS